LVDEVRRELTDLIHQLRPVALTDGGLADALREYAVDWMQLSSIEMAVQVQGERPLPLDVERSLFRIAQEALSNVARHSQAQSAELSLVYEADAVTLTISDDGRGFDTGSPRGGLGLRSMRERAEALGGTLIIESALEQGTCMRVRLENPDDRCDHGSSG
jgi:signal transduction histidine kinase